MRHTGLTVKQVDFTYSSNLNSALAWAQTPQLNCSMKLSEQPLPVFSLNKPELFQIIPRQFLRLGTGQGPFQKAQLGVVLDAKKVELYGCGQNTSVGLRARECPPTLFTGTVVAQLSRLPSDVSPFILLLLALGAILT